jgi:hypothetical protein
MRENFRHQRFARPAAFAHKFRSRLRAAIYLGISAGILMMFFGSLALLAQTIPHYQLELDKLVQQKRYIELERDLQTMQDLSASDRAFYGAIRPIAKTKPTRFVFLSLSHVR